MGEEIQQEPTWRKNIPAPRDRIQSQVLASVVGALLTGLTAWTLALAHPITAGFTAFTVGSIAVSVLFATAAWLLKAATPAAATCGGVICFLLTYWTGSPLNSLSRSALLPLAVLFLITFLATRAGRQKKAKVGLAEPRTGRTASQVIANLSVSALCATPFAGIAINNWIAHGYLSTEADLSLTPTLMKIMCLAALSEAAADTVSSEIGQAFGGVPVMLPSLRQVEPGTDGAVTLLGTLSGAAACALVTLAGTWSMHLQLQNAVAATAAGTGGLFFDSFLGATIERRGWLGNDLVNFSSTAFAAAIAAALYQYFL